MLESCKHDSWEMKDARNLKQRKTGKKKKKTLPQVVVKIVCPPPPTITRTQWIYMWEFQVTN